MKIASYLIFIKLIYCLPTDCYSTPKQSVQTLQQTDQQSVQQTDQQSVQQTDQQTVQQSVQQSVQQTDQQSVNSQNGVTSKATFYFRLGENVQGCPDVQTFNDGNRYGPCSENGLQGVKYKEDSKYWAAIANGGSRCGEMITVNYGTNSLQLKVMDDCPACALDNHVDMSLEALIELTGSKDNACAINTVLPMITWY